MNELIQFHEGMDFLDVFRVVTGFWGEMEDPS